MLRYLSWTGLAIAGLTLPLLAEARADIYDATVICTVRGLQSGQLALRPEPNGTPFAGLDNGNVVQAFAGTLDAQGRTWSEVVVLDGPNARVEGRRGWVNDSYLGCNWYDEAGNLIRRDP